MGFAAEAQPPGFAFTTIAGTTLRYLDTGGVGTPVVLLHGNGSMIEDFLCSGLIDRAGPGYRFIAFDRPGFGHSQRPRERAWGPSEQASLMLDAMARLGVQRPIVVGRKEAACHTVDDLLGNPRGTATDHRGAERHRLDDDAAEWLGVDRRMYHEVDSAHQRRDIAAVSQEVHAAAKRRTSWASIRP